MTSENDADISDDTLKESVIAARSLFKSIQKYLQDQISEAENPKKDTPKALVAKLSEFQTAAVQLVKAEEAFNARIQTKGGNDPRDYDAIRFEIGRTLDRLRDASVSRRFSKPDAK